MGYFDDTIDKKEEHLEHHGIRGQKWGVRRFQNADGSLTSQGKAHYGSGSDKVEKKLNKATKWEDRAVNAKTGVGRNFAAAIATSKRQAADKAADKATGNYNMFAMNKNASRNLAAGAETQSRIAEGIKKKADSETGAKHDKLVNNAIKHLASANNLEAGAKAYDKVANTNGVKKGAEFIKQTIKLGFGEYQTSAGRKTSFGDRFLESVGNSVIDAAINGAAQKATDGYAPKTSVATAVNATGKIRDQLYRNNTSADKRWEKISK